jgi:transcriptional regulator with XRE-family HTH domain
MAKTESTALRVERLLKRRGWTPYKCAQAAGVNRSTLSRILSGECAKPSLDTVAKLAVAFGGLTYGQVRGTEPLRGEK